MVCTCETTHPHLVEEMVNDSALPPSMQGWRAFRIEYGYECSCPEGWIYLPPIGTLEISDRIEEMLSTNYTNETGSWERRI